MLFKSWSSFCCALFWTTWIVEFGKVFYSCGEFYKLSNGISYNFIGLTEWELRLFYCAAVFHSMRKNQVVCSHLCTWVSLGCQDALMLVHPSRRRCKLPFLCPLVDLFLRGVAKLKKLQDEGFICSGASLQSIGYVSGWDVTIKHRYLC